MEGGEVVPLALLLVLVAATGCGSKTVTTTPSKSTAPGSVSAIDIAGPWIVSGQPESQYYLSFRPEGTYGMKHAGVTSGGTFILKGDTVRLISTDGSQTNLKYIKGADMMQDQLVGDVTWVRV